MPTGIHWAPRRGTHEEARDYAKKDDTRADGPWEFGEEPKQGKRSDLAEVAEYVKRHTLKEVAENFPGTFIRNHRGITTYRNLVKFTERPDDFKTELIIYWEFGAQEQTTWPRHSTRATSRSCARAPRTAAAGGTATSSRTPSSSTSSSAGCHRPALPTQRQGQSASETKFGFVPFNSNASS